MCEATSSTEQEMSQRVWDEFMNSSDIFRIRKKKDPTDSHKTFVELLRQSRGVSPA